jgi:antitoxin VapB
MTGHRHVRLFRNGHNQAVRIPVEFELPGDEAIMHRDGDRLVIEPVRKRGLVALLKSMKPLDEDFPEIDDPVPGAGERALTRYLLDTNIVSDLIKNPQHA